MSTYHLTEAGPRPCKATKRACPLGGTHYNTPEEARIAFEEAMTQAHGALPATRKQWQPTASSLVLEEGFGGLTSGVLADKLLALDGEYGSILEGDLQNGSCGDLAAYMAATYGVSHKVVADLGLPGMAAYSLHAVAELPDGRILDSRGVWPGEKELLEAWGGEEGLSLISQEELIALDPSWASLTEESFYSPPPKVKEAARVLAEEVGLKPRTPGTEEEAS